MITAQTITALVLAFCSGGAFTVFLSALAIVKKEAVNG